MSKINHPKLTVEGEYCDVRLYVRGDKRKRELPALWLREHAPSSDQIEEVLKWTRARYMLLDTVRCRASSNIVPRFD